MAADYSKRNVRALMSRIRAYERLFKEQEKANEIARKKGKSDTGPDNQAHTAYMNLIKLVHALEKNPAEGDSAKAEEITDEKAREVLRDIFGI